MNKNSNTTPVYFAVVENENAGDVQVTQNRDTPELAAKDAEELIANVDVEDWNDYSVQIVSLVASSAGWKKPTRPVLDFTPSLAELVLKGKV